MAGAEILTHAWKEWGIQTLVLLSFTLQVTLLILSDFRRYVNSVVLRFVLWSAYMAADSTAIFVLGHLSVTSMLPEHKLRAFWAPFLLMHLGGQDNITGYAIEDSRLWLRHLQTLVVQAVATGYIIFVSFNVGPLLLRWATFIMFVVGIVKYAERVWALKFASSSQIGKNYRNLTSGGGLDLQTTDLYLEKLLSTSPTDDTEAYLLMAQHTLDVSMDLLKGPGLRNAYYTLPIDLRENGRLYKVVELQLSLMYDVFYTKAEILHSNLFGLCIRILSVVATVAALLLFQKLVALGDHHHLQITYNRVDIVVTYVLLAGAIILETTSLLREMFSSWTYAFMIKWNRERLDYEMWEHDKSRGYRRRMVDCEKWNPGDYGVKHVLRHFVVHNLMSLRRLVHVADWRSRYCWSRSMGQHDLLQVCTRSKTSRSSKIARWMKVEDWWNTLTCSWSIPIPPLIENRLMEKLLARKGDDRFDLWGEEKLRQWGIYELNQDPYERRVLFDWSLENRIIIWHIATSIYLNWFQEKQQTKPPEAVEALYKAVEALSNYLMFLLASRPHMLPPTSSRNAYVDMCYVLTTHSMPGSDTDDADPLLGYLRKAVDDNDIWKLRDARLKASGKLAAELMRGSGGPTPGATGALDPGAGTKSRLTRSAAILIHNSDPFLWTLGPRRKHFLGPPESEGKNNMLEQLAQVWVEALCYVGKNCSAYSHTKHLSNGSELATVAALLVAHMNRIDSMEKSTMGKYYYELAVGIIKHPFYSRAQKERNSFLNASSNCILRRLKCCRM